MSDSDRTFVAQAISDLAGEIAESIAEHGPATVAELAARLGRRRMDLIVGAIGDLTHPECPFRAELVNGDGPPAIVLTGNQPDVWPPVWRFGGYYGIEGIEIMTPLVALRTGPEATP